MPNVGVVADHCIRPARPLRQQGGQPPFVDHHAARGSCPVQEEMQLEGNIPSTDRVSPAGHRFRCSRLLCTRCRRRGVVYTAFRWRLGSFFWLVVGACIFHGLTQSAVHARLAGVSFYADGILIFVSGAVAVVLGVVAENV